MRRYHVLVIVALLLLGVYAAAFGQDGEQIFIPSISGGIADDSSTPTKTSTVTPTPTATATKSGPTSTPTTTPTATTTPATPIVADLFVDDDNTSDTEDGTAQFPFNTLQEAIDATADNEIIAVAAGTYTENVTIQNSTIHLFGGFVGADATTYANGDGGDFTSRDASVNVTHILGDQTDSVVTMIEAGTSTVDGFRITNGTRSLLPEFARVGGGFYIQGGAPTISNNLIEDNNTHLPAEPNNEPAGGGIFADGSDIIIQNNIIRNNTSGRGGGIGINGGTVIIRNNTVQGNHGNGLVNGDHGGGLYIASPHVEISHNLIIGNEIGRDTGYGYGGGVIVYGDDSHAFFSFNTITENYAPSVGGGTFIDDGAEAILDHELIYNNVCPDGGTTGGVGLYVDGYSDPPDNILRSYVTVLNTTIAGHDCETQGGNALYVEGYSGVTVTNSIFWDNNGDDFYVDPTSAITVTYTTAEETVPGVGNLSIDPLFADEAAFDYHLQSSAGRWDDAANGGSGGFVIDTKDSPAIDAGDPTSPFANELSPNGGRVNMGVYGNTAEASKSAP